MIMAALTSNQLWTINFEFDPSDWTAAPRCEHGTCSEFDHARVPYLRLASVVLSSALISFRFGARFAHVDNVVASSS